MSDSRKAKRTGSPQGDERGTMGSKDYLMSQEEQTRRLEARIHDERKVWKLSPMDLKSYSRWYEYSRARDDMFVATDTDFAPWHVVNSNHKKRARLNIISDLLGRIPYKRVPRATVPDYPFRFIEERF
ncbi:MAG: hypothetical protein JO239_09405 [Paraburkholderia sp.]|nr:hypothetical protein [Paraburkholderia sp.]